MIRKALRRILARTAKGVRKPGDEPSAGVYLGYAKACRVHAISRPYLVLSFDCDTPLDATAAEAVATRLGHLGIPAVFAVPGIMVEESKKSYAAIAQSGFEFLNHGYLNHAAWDEENERYYGITWYHTMTESEVREDIRRGDASLRSCLNIRPLGFRAPHFGYYQSEEQLDVIYSETAKLGYSYSTTTMPAAGLLKGGLFPANLGIMEFPVTGTYDWPEVILDSWQFLAAPDRVYDGAEYASQFRKMVDFFGRGRLPCVLNFYSDPSHVVEFEGFFECIEYALECGLEASTYTSILSKTPAAISGAGGGEHNRCAE